MQQLAHRDFLASEGESISTVSASAWSLLNLPYFNNARLANE